MADNTADPPRRINIRNAAPKPCPICGKASMADLRPFCSKRCADVDLNRWLGGVYAVPAEGDADMHSATGDEPES